MRLIARSAVFRSMIPQTDYDLRKLYVTSLWFAYSKPVQGFGLLLLELDVRLAFHDFSL